MTPENIQVRYVVAVCMVSGLEVAFVADGTFGDRCRCVVVNMTNFEQLSAEDSKYWTQPEWGLLADLGTHKVVFAEGFEGNSFDDMPIQKIAQLAGVL